MKILDVTTLALGSSFPEPLFHKTGRKLLAARTTLTQLHVDALLRAGIKKSSLKEGDKVTVVGAPMKDGRPAGSLRTVTKLDSNETLYFRGRPPGATPPAPPPAG